MAGKLINLVPKQTYTFYNAANQSNQLLIGQRTYDSVGVVSGVLLVRVASLTMPANATLQIGVANCLVQPDDPGSLYVPGSSNAFANITINAADTISAPGRLYVVGFPAAGGQPVGPMFQVAYTVTYGAASSAGSATFAVDMVARDA